MKVSKKFLSIPPYISSSWDHINSIRLQNTDLLIHLKTGETVTVPNLKPEVLEAIFNFHAIYLDEKECKPVEHAVPVQQKSHLAENPGESTFKIGFGGTPTMSAAMQHNPELADSPELPPEVLAKISAISKIVSPEDVLIPKAEPHCNCPYCQIARSIHGSIVEVDISHTKDENEEEVKEEDLRFQEWDIIQSGEKLFTVTNKLDSHEKYSVYLGHPVGCTCGKDGCEHILAVLRG